MGQFVTKNPRAAYVNYRDLDIGQNAVVGGGVTSYDSGRVWGEKYLGRPTSRGWPSPRARRIRETTSGTNRASRHLSQSSEPHVEWPHVV